MVATAPALLRTSCRGTRGGTRSRLAAIAWKTGQNARCITLAVCAAIKAQTDDVDNFVEVFCKLALDPDYYEECQRATAHAQLQFYDRSQGLGAVLARAIAALG
jgi:hypothetical protein